MNIEIVLSELHSILFWCSFIELCVFGLGLLLFFTFPEQMAYIFLHVLHAFRGFIGLILNKKLPKSHDIIKEFQVLGDQPVKFEEFRQKMTAQMRTTMITLAEQNEGLLKTYFIATSVAAIFDIVDFFIQVVHFGHIGDVSKVLTNLGIF